MKCVRSVCVLWIAFLCVAAAAVHLLMSGGSAWLPAALASGACILALAFRHSWRRWWEKAVRRLARAEIAAIVGGFPGGVAVFDRDRRLVCVNSRYSAIYDIDAALLTPGMSEQDLRSLREALRLPRIGDEIQVRVHYGDGDCEYTTESWSLEDGRTICVSRYPIATGGWIAHHTDVTDELRQQLKLEQTSQFLDTIIENAPSAILVKDAATGKYVLVNTSAEKLLDIPRSSLVGCRSDEVFPAGTAERILKRDEAALASKGETESRHEDTISFFGMNRKVIQSRRHVVYDGSGNATHLLIVVDDITARREAEDQIRFLAMHDPLTGLYNRAWFSDHVNRTLDEMGEDGEAAVALLDLDGFKAVNDTFGHGCGDRLLKSVASRLSQACHHVAVGSRLGGDEFAVMFKPGADRQTIGAMLAGMMEAIKAPCVYEDQKVSVGVSIGVAFAGAGNRDFDNVLRQADVALYEAKRNGKSEIVFYQPGMMREWDHRKTAECELRAALDNNEFELHYQPIVSAAHGEIVCMEALLRWRHPSLGLIAPNNFIPLAEASGLIIPIGAMVLSMACHAAAGWPSHVRVSVNLSPIQFRDRTLGEKISAIIKASGIEPTRVELEITEATLLCDNEQNLNILHSLRRTGVRIVMDDFGKGYSSLNYIRSFPFDKIKIDKSYIDGLLCEEDNSARILHALFNLARDLRLETAAEGVEFAAQSEALIREGCDELQGFYYGAPAPEAEVWKMLGGKSAKRSKVA